MRFLTKIKINEDVVSKGIGPNKRDAKMAAS
jgi:dsRNA-specific ribonuclease